MEVFTEITGESANYYEYYMMTLSNGNIFRVTDPSCGEFPVTGEFPHKGQWRDVSLICGLNKRLIKQSWGWWFEMPSRSLWHHCNEYTGFTVDTDPSPNVNVATLEILERISNSIPHITGHAGIKINPCQEKGSL